MLGKGGDKFGDSSIIYRVRVLTNSIRLCYGEVFLGYFRCNRIPGCLWKRRMGTESKPFYIDLKSNPFCQE